MIKVKGKDVILNMLAKQLPIYTSSQQRATLASIWGCASAHWKNLGPVFTCHTLCSGVFFPEILGILKNGALKDVQSLCLAERSAER